VTESYGFWTSPITSDLIVARSIGLSEVRLDGPDLYWLESRPDEAGRSVVVRYRGGVAADVTPRPFDVRTRVHEYGGGAWTVAGGALYFSHDADRRLYRLDPGAAEASPITAPGPWRYADGIIDRDRQRWIGVREDHTAAGREPVNAIVSIDLDSGDARVLAAGHDFYSSPKLSPDGRRLAYLAWDHPRMPWMGTTLYVQDLKSGQSIALAGGEKESIFQPEWSFDGAHLYFVSDRTGWWNLYSLDMSQPAATPRNLTPISAEFGRPQWVFGMSAYACAGPHRIVASNVERGLTRLALLDTSTAASTPLDLPFTDFSSVHAAGDRVLFRAGSATTPASVVFLNLATGGFETLKTSTALAGDPALASHFTGVRSIEFPTTGGRSAFALYYPPHNPGCEAPSGEKPPLLVKCHGGPTSAASSTLDLRTQYWTSRGVAVLDVNYGGSTGYGRAYRERLDGQWGIVDVDDAVNGARYLAQQGLVDGRRSVIAGGSAGGYTVLAALTFRDYFSGGASYYGVSDLGVLVRDTHKFESRYLDSLVGAWPEMEAVYRQRSPIFHTERLSAPTIFFQGDEDPVVPPNQAELMVDALRKKGTPVVYLLFKGEQHGFRKSENIKRALDAELEFYQKYVFSLV
jgi:dipeptidyl aminopeptidase/acylaminoacyl peptidase